MPVKSIILGSAITVVLLTVLVATRMMVLTQAAPEFEIREVDTVSLPEPPPPPPEQLPAEELPPPPPPALEDLHVSLDVSQPVLPLSQQRVNPRMAVDSFFTDEPPAPLPVITKATPRQVSKPEVRPSPSLVASPAPPAPKSDYSLGELDQKPRLLRNPSVVFPRSIKNTNTGRVVVRVAIHPSGRSEFLAVISSTHPDLVPLAQRIASGSRFTSPTRQGKAVKVVMSWPIIIKK